MPDLYDFIGGLEGFSPKAYWDNKQWSIGYGTKANGPNEVIDQAEGRRRLESEVNKARGFVDESFPNLESPRRDALTSFTYNVGPGWMTGPTRMAAAVRSGDWDTAAKVMQEYNKGNGQVLPGLLDRRRRESALMLGSPLDQSAPSAPPSPGRSPMADPYTTSPDEMVTPEDVAARRKYGSMLLEQALSGGNPRTGWGAIGNLALGLSGGLYSDSARKAELAGQMAASRALQDALKSGNAQDALARGLATPYGLKMLGGTADKVLAGNIQDQSPMGKLQLERAQLENEMLKRKDWLSEAIAREAGLNVPPPVGSAPSAPASAAPAPSPTAPGSTTLTNVPGMVVAPPGATIPSALPNGKTLKQLFAERTPAEKLEFLLTMQKDQAKAAEIINKWANPLNAAEQARQKETGEALGKAQADLPRIEANVNRVLKQIDEVSGDKNLPNVTGWNAKTPTIRPTSIATENRIKQLGGAAFLEMYNALRGGGAITEAEGAKATAALARLDTHQDTKSFRAALKDFRDEVINLREVARQRAQTVGTPAVGSQAAGATIPQVPNAAPPVPQKAPDGKFYIPDPDRPGKYLRVDQ